MRLYSTLARELVALPEPPGPVRMYVCGPTVYARAHVGNARPFVIAMWLRAWLQERGYDVVLVHNITDVNDKIYEAAPGGSAALAEQATAWYLEDTGDFGLGMPDHLPKATDSVPGIIAFIEQLLERDFAYAVDGDVYFRVAKDPGYGRLSGQRPDQVEEQEPSALKQDPRDFALWKANKPGEDTAWDAPWGRGRPGWHIECSVMAEELLGPAFEIHGGGLDLVFPHHENELAQSLALGHDYADIWMHNGMLRFVGEKMSKSLGNVLTIREALDEWGAETLLLFFLSAHWRKPVDLSVETLTAARAQGESFRNAFIQPPPRIGAIPPWEAFVAALDDDFNTPEALAILHAWRTHGFLDLVERGLRIFGLSDLVTLQAAPSRIHELARARASARAEKRFGDADLYRAEIAAAGWEVRDIAEPPGYRLVPIA
jgi:cysteinyl-tRNA synthetase